MADETVLVTGGAGFIGSHLCERLLEQGERVLCLDNFATGSRRNIEHLLDRARFELLEHDVCIPFDSHAARVFHLACPASPVVYGRDPAGTARTAVLGTLNVLDAARRSGARVAQASTSEIYGDPLEHPQRESYRGNVDPLGPRACYNEAKRCAETLCSTYRGQHGVDVRIARIFNTYGPRMQPDDGRVVCNFITQALRGDELTVFGDGTQTRSFCYVTDTVDALLRMMQVDVLDTPVNIGNTHECSMLELAEHVIRLTGSDSGIGYRPLPDDDPARRLPDIARARELLGWQPSIELDPGLRDTIAWFRRLPDRH